LVGAGDWVNDHVNSPCIDKADPASDYSNEPQPNLGRVNMGAYGNTDEASKSGWKIPGDVTGDCAVTVLDLIGVRNHMYEDVSTDDNWRYDLTGDGFISVLDLIAVRNALLTLCE